MSDLENLARSFSGRLLTAPEDTEPFLVDWRKLWRGQALAVAQPERPEDVATIVRWCARHRVPIVPQGGNTSMSGGATPDADGKAIVLSLTRLNRVRHVDPLNDTIAVDAGCILTTVQEEADKVGRVFPLSLGAEGSCTIGGNLATNAGGTAVLRYGNTRDLCLGVEVVTAQGEIWDGMRALRKDNTGYDLRDLFIGSEGTLGIITGAVMKLFPKPAARLTAFVGMPGLDEALELLHFLRRRFDSALTAYEFLSDTCLELVEHHVPGARSPLQSRCPWYSLIELSLPTDDDEPAAGFEAALGDGLENGWIEDAALASSIAQRQAMWLLRESISEAQGAVGKTIKHDIALPISAIAQFVAQADAAISRRWSDIRFVTFGHLGDGNLHYNFSPAPEADQAAFMADQDAINGLVHDIVASLGGSFSAEHGIGVLRRGEAQRLKAPIEMALMRTIKQALDPMAILNPGKVLA